MPSLDAMIDIETLGTRHDSSIIALGVCTYDGLAMVTKEYTIRPDYEYSMPATMDWWHQQEGGSDFLLDLDFNAQYQTLQSAWSDVLDDFGWRSRKTARDTQFWCRGMEFDFKLLNAQLDTVPWQFYQCHDLRTLHKVWGTPKNHQMPKNVAHRAGLDAEHQMALLQAIRADIGSGAMGSDGLRR